MKKRLDLIILALVLASVALAPLIVFQGCGSDPYTIGPTNHAPIVSAGTATSVANGTPVQLSGTASDPDGDMLTYSWSVTLPADTPNTVFSDPTILNPLFTPSADDTAYLLTLTANDGQTTSSNSVLVAVGNPPDPPPYNASIVINNGAAKVYKVDVTLALHAEDNKGVVAYFVSENSTPPAADDAGWVTVTSTPTYNATGIPFTLTDTFGMKTVYVWFKDADNGISQTASDTIELADSGGTT